MTGRCDRPSLEKHLRIRLGGGAATVRQYLQAGRIDDLRLAVRPVLLGAGEPPSDSR